MKRIHYFHRIWLGVSCLLFAALAFAEDAKEAASGPPKKQVDASNFIRVRRDEKKNPVAMETSIVRYAPVGKGRQYPTVDLVAAFHIGEKKYYEELNRAFESYDVVLYELVAPLGTRVPKGGGKSDSMVSKVQKFMKDTLALDFQLEHIDYTKPNFVHADMSAQDIAKSMSEKGETWFTILVKMMSFSMAQQAKNGGDDGSAELLVALFSKNRALALKRAIANQMDVNDTLSALEGAAGSTLIGGRNKIALDVLRKQIDAGKRKIAIFYGGGHMPDMDKRLREDFGLAPGETRWLTAWDLKEKEAEKKR
ncbi:MAG: hypothetical protein IT426_08910 [Pirellulales bacterium]|nr:hypothetical protein [Pirellulales bacterium]